LPQPLAKAGAQASILNREHKLNSHVISSYLAAS